MKQVWIMDWTEYEFGSRPDGTSMHIGLPAAQAFRKSHETGNDGQFWRASDPRTINVSDEKYAEVFKNGGHLWATQTYWLKTQEMAVA